MKTRIAHWSTRILAPALAATLSITGVSAQAQAPFDHGYRAYAKVLDAHVQVPRVDYAALVKNRQQLDAVVEELGRVSSTAYDSWTRTQQIAFWINAYNVFTLRSIVDNYPIEGGWFSLHPSNSIRQIDGVWDELRWEAGGRSVTLDQIEHEILRPTFKEARAHFAVNCASVSCPPLQPEPYIAERLDAQLDAAARAYLGSEHGLQLRGSRLELSSILDWYGDDFIAEFASQLPGGRPAKERSVLAVVATFGPPEAAALAKSDKARVGYLSYDWSLNDVATAPGGSP